MVPTAIHTAAQKIHPAIFNHMTTGTGQKEFVHLARDHIYLPKMINLAFFICDNGDRKTHQRA